MSVVCTGGERIGVRTAPGIASLRYGHPVIRPPPSWFGLVAEVWSRRSRDEEEARRGEMTHRQGMQCARVMATGVAAPAARAVDRNADVGPGCER